MRAVVQRVDSAAVEAEGAMVGSVGKGLLVLLGVSFFGVSLNGKQFLRGHRWHGGGLLGPAPNPEPRAMLARSGSVALLIIFSVSIAPVLSFYPARHSPADNQCLLSPC